MSKMDQEKNCNGIPKGWTNITLGEITTHSKNGITGRPSNNPPGVPRLGITSITSSVNGYVIEEECKYQDVSASDLQKYNVEKDDLLICRQNGNKRYVGKSAVYNGETKPLIFSDSLIRFRLDTNMILPLYLALFLNSENGRNQLDQWCATTAGNFSINGPSIKKIELFIPPLDEQKRIASKIEELFSKIYNVSKTLEKTKEQIRIYEKLVIFNALSGNITEDWRKIHFNLNGNETLSKIFEERRYRLGKKYKEIEPEIQNTLRIPESWIWTSLNNVSKKIVDGTHHTPAYTESGIPFLSVKDIKNDRLNFEDCRFISKKDHEDLIKRCNPEFNDILITKSGTIGRTAVVNTQNPFSLFVSVALIKIFNKNLNPYFLSYVLKNFINHIDISQKIKGGVIKNFHLEDLRLVPVPIPHIGEQIEIVNRLDTHMLIINNYKKSVDMLKQKIEILKSSILKTAFEGKIVTQDPTDEPAEFLLQNIMKQEREKSQESQRVIKDESVTSRRKKNAK